TLSGYSATLDNTATATSTNNTPSSISASAEDIVLAPSLNVTKTPDAATVNSTDPVGFTITVTNAVGAGTAYGVDLPHPLPDSTNDSPRGISASAADIVLAPSLNVTKTPDAATVNSTDPVGFTITVTNAVGAGTAYGVDLTDPLPDSNTLNWTASAGTITSGT